MSGELNAMSVTDAIFTARTSVKLEMLLNRYNDYL